MLWGKNSWGKKFRGFLFLLVSVAVIFGLLSTRCGTKSEKSGPTVQTGYPGTSTGQTGFPGTSTGQTGFPGTSTGQTGFPAATTFTGPSDAATKIFGSLSAGPANNIITARSFQGEKITGRVITARIITGRVAPVVPKFLYDDYENNLLSGRLKGSSLSEKQSEGFELSCEGIKPGECTGGGKIEGADCNIDQSKGLLIFQIRLSDCKEIIDQSKGDYIVSTGYAKGYIKVSAKTSSNGFESSIIFAIEDGDLLVREFRGNKESRRVRTKYSGYKNEFIYGFISVDKDVEMKYGTKLSGSYSREDEIGKRKEAYSYYDFASVLTGKFPSSGEYQSDITSLANYLSISGGYSVDTEPSSCAEGIFYYRTIKPIKFGLFEVFSREGFCGAESGEIEVNNAKITFSSGRVNIEVVIREEYQGGTTVAVEQAEAVQYKCEELATLCEYEPITVAEGLEKGGGTPAPHTFAKAIGGNDWDGAYSIIQDSDGGYVVAGSTGSFGAGSVDIYLVKLDSEGNIVWTKTIGGSGIDVAYSIIRSSDGGYVVAGYTRNESSYYDDSNIYVMKLDSGGNVVWAKTIGKSSIGGTLWEVAWSIIQSSDGGYVVAGYTGAGSDIYLVKLDSSGNVIWIKTIGGQSGDVAYSIIQSSDGGYVVAGYTYSFGAGGSDVYVVKLDSAGNVVWNKTIGGIGDDIAYSVIQSSDGGYVVAGYTQSFGAGIRDIYLVKLDSGGNVVWSKTIGGRLKDEANSITQSSDGGYVVAGYTQSFGAGGSDMYLVKLDSSGNVQWTKTIGGRSADGAYSIIQSSDGGYVVAGYTESFGAGGSDMYVVKMDANGNVCFSRKITNYSVSSTVPSFSSPSPVSYTETLTSTFVFGPPTMVNSVSPTVGYGGSVSDVCASASAPYLYSASQDCGFSSAIATNRENVKSYGYSAGGIFSRFLIPASMLIVYGQLRKKRKKKKGF
jgi:uncharacterized delta-60 repeat protein